MTKEQKIRERLVETIKGASRNGYTSFDDVADAILREFALRPVSQGKVDSETGEVEPL